MAAPRVIVALAMLMPGFGAIRAQELETSAVASAPAYVILMQISVADTTECNIPICAGLGKPLIDGILALENNARRKSLRQQLDVLRARLPDLHLYEVVRSAFCREVVRETNPACAQVTVLGPESPPLSRHITKDSPVERATNTIVVRLSVEYTRMMRFNELRVIAALSEVVAEEGKPMLYVWYVTPGGNATQSSPLDPPEKPCPNNRRPTRTGSAALPDRS